jgi:hypothetical protein
LSPKRRMWDGQTCNSSSIWFGCSRAAITSPKQASRTRSHDRRLCSDSRTIQPGNLRSPRPGPLPDALIINSASACGFRRGRSPRMRRGPARKSRGPIMPELFRASSNQLPCVGILLYERAVVERVQSVCPTPPCGTLEGRPLARARHQPLGRPCPMPGMPIHMVSSMCANKIGFESMSVWNPTV